MKQFIIDTMILVIRNPMSSGDVVKIYLADLYMYIKIYDYAFLNFD